MSPKIPKTQYFELYQEMLVFGASFHSKFWKMYGNRGFSVYGAVPSQYIYIYIMLELC